MAGVPPPPPPAPMPPGVAHLLANMHPPRLDAPDVPVDSLGLVEAKTPAQVQALRADKNYRPPLGDFFDNTPHPLNLDQNGAPLTMIQQANVAITLIQRVLSTEIHEAIIRNETITTNFNNYIACFMKGMIVTIILHMAYGWNATLRAHQQSIDSLVQWLAHDPNSTQADRNYFITWVQPYINYIWNWMIEPNHPYANFRKVQNYKFRTFRDTFVRGSGRNSRGGRMQFPVWSNNFVLTSRIKRGMSGVCNGHFRPYFLMADLVLRDFSSKLQAPQYYVLPGENVAAALAAQRHQRLYTE
jgi:hypothetical protein